MTRWTKEERDWIRTSLPRPQVDRLRVDQWLLAALDMLEEVDDELGAAQRDPQRWVPRADYQQLLDGLNGLASMCDALMLVAQRFEKELNETDDRRWKVEEELQNSGAECVNLRVLRWRAEAERDELGEMLLHFEWSAREGLKPACARCHRSIDWWHAEDCELGALCDRVRARKAAAETKTSPDAPPPQASAEKGAPRPDPLRNEVVSTAPAGAPEAGPFPAPPGANQVPTCATEEDHAPRTAVDPTRSPATAGDAGRRGEQEPHRDVRVAGGTVGEAKAHDRPGACGGPGRSFGADPSGALAVADALGVMIDAARRSVGLPPEGHSREEARACAPHAAVVAAPTGAEENSGSTLTSSVEPSAGTPKSAQAEGAAPMGSGGAVGSASAPPGETSRVEVLESALRKIQSHLLDSDSRDFRLSGRLRVASMLAIIGNALHGEPCPNASTGGG